MIYTDVTVTASQILGSSFDFDFECRKMKFTENEFPDILCLYGTPNIPVAENLNLISVIDEFMALNFSAILNVPNADFKYLRAPT